LLNNGFMLHGLLAHPFFCLLADMSSSEGGALLQI
jgi:hypothetical protein